MNYFISCDWGTSSFRLRLIDAATGKIVAEIFSAQGIATTYALWKEQQSIERFVFYRNYLSTQIASLEKDTGTSLHGVTLVLSGMASSAIGMKELAYKKLPFNINPENLNVHIEAPTSLFPHTIIIVSGACSTNDVMRGEETILAGCDINRSQKQLFIFPGTHSKHIVVEDGSVTSVRTYMTGELFDLLSSKSILSGSVEKHDAILSSPAFLKSIEDASVFSFLNAVFHVRTNDLFSTLDKKNNYAYLSGLLIGEELKSLQEDMPVIIVSSGNLAALYEAALLHKQCAFSIADADKALIKAQTIIVDHYQ
jgi:2-dehydro-3-deoxygalactonokinase